MPQFPVNPQWPGAAPRDNGFPAPNGDAHPQRGHVARMPSRGPQREPARSGLHVVGRNGEVLTRSNRTNERGTQFDLPPALMADRDWTYQWVAVSCYNMELPQQVNAMHENGWRPVPSNRCPGFFHDKNHTGSIVRDGQMLMERPRELTEQAIADGIRAARGEMKKQHASFQGASAIHDGLDAAGDHFGIETYDSEVDSIGFTAPKIKRSVEGAPTGLYPRHERPLQIGDDE